MANQGARRLPFPKRKFFGMQELVLPGMVMVFIAVNVSLNVSYPMAEPERWPDPATTAVELSPLPASKAFEMKESVPQNDEAKDVGNMADKQYNVKENFLKGGAWHEHPLVVESYNNRLKAGSSSWPVHLKERYGIRKNCLSIGCGGGGMEYNLVIADVCGHIRGMDFSEELIQEANNRVPPNLKDRLEFIVENATEQLASSSRKYDMVLFAHTLHHVTDLERMAETVRNILWKDGILVIEEYVGPPRWQFALDQRLKMAQFLADIERKHPSFVPVLRQNSLWNGTTIDAPDASAIQSSDPTEAARSSEIVPILQQKFEIVEDVPLGGTFFQWIFHDAYHALNDQGEGTAIVQAMLDEEMRLIMNKELHSDFVFQVWKKKY